MSNDKLSIFVIDIRSHEGRLFRLEIFAWMRKRRCAKLDTLPVLSMQNNAQTVMQTQGLRFRFARTENPRELFDWERTFCHALVEPFERFRTHFDEILVQNALLYVICFLDQLEKFRAVHVDVRTSAF